ncbi:hybrid sensor histidine kinase/response regulator [Paracoccus tegillarcae]|uniref:histidine kinase n=1 Tax=Paracoccus tegillarcae TaxID=1529068 RepID=A0A2K9EJD0_9RHOB|nr:PAS domain-containing sensor histidine kinase [Paracoccus tegillarcae]AUH35110.1 hybrid sensor histidine kinase/response regulator [Paracoccus tegillarcae]
MARWERLIGLPRNAIVFLPALMLPALLGSALLVMFPDSSSGKAAIIFATIAVAWYILGGAMSLLQAARGMAGRRALSAIKSEVVAAPEPIWITDSDGLVLFQNAASLDGFGDIVGRSILTWIAHIRADASNLIEDLMNRADRSGFAEAELPDGDVLALGRSVDAPLQIWSYHGLDEASSDEAEEDDSEPEPEDEFDALPVSLLRLSGDGIVRRANPTARRLLGSSPIDIHLGKILEGPGRPVGDWLADVAAGRTDQRAEMLRLRGADTDRHFQISLARDPVQASGHIAVLTDASALKTLEAQFVQSQKMQAIGQLAGGVAHDFNNLLTAISGHCELLMMRHDKADQDYADLDQISQNANRAAALVSQLLAFSRKQTMKPEILDLRDILADLTHLLNRLVGGRVALNILHDAQLLPIRADKRQLEQVIMNLVVNARDAMPSGGDITIQTRNIHLDEAFERDRAVLAKGSYVMVELRDEGNGIAPKHLTKIFEPFFTTKRTGEGTGLGLSTVYGIIKQTGGFIFCDSTLGQGTVFTLYFPAHEGAKPKELEKAAGAAQMLTETSGATILLVEDEAPVRAFAARALRLKGYEVLEAENAEAALALLSDSDVQIDVFVTDVVMPGMDGPSWVRSALRDRPETRVVFISGYSEEIFAEGQSPVPNSVFLAKPFSLAELTQTVARHLAGDNDDT